MRLGRHTFADDAMLVMAIVNRTPDSFYDKGATFAEDKAMERVDLVVEQGTDIVDIGGVKAAPGGDVDVAEQVVLAARLRRGHPFILPHHPPPSEDLRNQPVRPARPLCGSAVTGTPAVAKTSSTSE